LKKRIPIFLVALFLLLTTPVYAAQDSTENFQRTKTYEHQFSDLTPDSTFYGNISALYEYGLSIGKVDGTYGTQDSLTIGQAVIFAGRIRSLYRTGNPESGASSYLAENQTAAEPYLLYLQAEGVLDTELDTQLSSVATRAQMAHVLANILPEDALPSVHTELVTQAYATRRAITDVTEYTPYFQDILSLYRKGICIGSDAAGSFLPDAPITRGAAAAMLTRMIDPALRMTPQWKLTVEIPDVSGISLADLVPPGHYVATPTTEAELEESLRYMLSSGENTLTLRYPEISFLQAREVMEKALSIVKTYCEQGYNTAQCVFSDTSSFTLTFSAAGIEEDISTYREASLRAAIAVHDELWQEGYLTEDMTQMEKALAYYIWICENCVYDSEADDTSLSHLPYMLFEHGKAVCDGYTGAYNLLLKLEGIECSTVITETHIWTSAILDGAEYHIDTTWGDTEQGASTLYFAMTPENSVLLHEA